MKKLLLAAAALFSAGAVAAPHAPMVNHDGQVQEVSTVRQMPPRRKKAVAQAVEEISSRHLRIRTKEKHKVLNQRQRRKRERQTGIRK